MEIRIWLGKLFRRQCLAILGCFISNALTCLTAFFICCYSLQYPSPPFRSLSFTAICPQRYNVMLKLGASVAQLVVRWPPHGQSYLVTSTPNQKMLNFFRKTYLMPAKIRERINELQLGSLPSSSFFFF